jgi:alanine-glyoxylate transaminase/serine-glyoxylate transaminase/serine-pyruvate transaminase
VALKPQDYRSANETPSHIVRRSGSHDLGDAGAPMTPGRHFLQIPGPSNVPSEVLRALSRDVIDHRGPEFAELTKGILQKLGRLVGSSSPIVIYPSSGTGAWEASLVNVLSPRDAVLIPETGYFSELWGKLASSLGYDARTVAGDWRRGVRADDVAAVLADDHERAIKAVGIVHNETSTGSRSDVLRIRQAIDSVGHDALLLVDTISSLGSAEYRHDDWGVDVMIGCSQKGLQLPPGLGLNVLSGRAVEAHRASTTPKGYWDWGPMLELNPSGYFPYTPPTNLLFGLDVSLDLLLAEGLHAVVARHDRLAHATRLAVDAWGLELQCVVPDELSNSLTAIRLGAIADADALRDVVLRRFDTSLGTGLGRLRGTVFRIGHLGSMNDPMLLGALGAVEAGLWSSGLASARSGVAAAVEYLAATPTATQAG